MRYPTGKIKASREYLRKHECISDREYLQLRQHRKDGYVDIQYLADLLNQI